MTENDTMDTCASPSSSLGQWEETFGFSEEKEQAVPLSPDYERMCTVNDIKCRFSPFNWVCKNYDLLENYQYFDGTPDSPDQRFLIDLDTDSMDGCVFFILLRNTNRLIKGCTTFGHTCTPWVTGTMPRQTLCGLILVWRIRATKQ